jgi:hypothetical protein
VSEATNGVQVRQLHARAKLTQMILHVNLTLHTLCALVQSSAGLVLENPIPMQKLCSQHCTRMVSVRTVLYLDS